MTDLTDPAARDALTERLKTRYQPRFVCDGGTDLAIEGYPRSANTFAVDMLTARAARAGLDLAVAHHTHDPDNLRLALARGVPAVVLIRPPRDAAASLMVYAGIDAGQAVARYVAFYRPLLAHRAALLVAPFAQVSGAFDSFAAALGGRFGLDLPPRGDLDAEIAAARAAEAARARAAYGDAYDARVALPTPRRRAALEAARAEVAATLLADPEADRLHAAFAGGTAPD